MGGSLPFGAPLNSPRCDARHSQRKLGEPRCNTAVTQGTASFGVGIMMSYSFDRSPIYSAGNVAGAWAVAGLLFAVLAFA